MPAMAARRGGGDREVAGKEGRGGEGGARSPLEVSDVNPPSCNSSVDREDKHAPKKSVFPACRAQCEALKPSLSTAFTSIPRATRRVAMPFRPS
jgi:hypothetical protein